MKLVIFTIGKLRIKPLGALIDEYADRLKHYTTFELLNAKSEEKLLEKLSKDDYVVICDEHGGQKTSQELASFLEKRQNQGGKKLIFVVGDAPGHSQDIKTRANEVLSLSKMTLQHEMAALILAEQLYRAFTILKGEPYHK
jgi:23S rRNA (pseudouridine1915-N3)-methyltransferase